MSEPDTTFHCPQCGSGHFGSSEEGGRVTRHCHGRTHDRSCRFTFPEEHDWKYFQLDGKAFDSKEEHDAWLERWRAEHSDVMGHAV